MLQTVAAWILRTYLGEYIENLNTDQLSVGYGMIICCFLVFLFWNIVSLVAPVSLRRVILLWKKTIELSCIRIISKQILLKVLFIRKFFLTFLYFFISPHFSLSVMAGKIYWG